MTWVNNSVKTIYTTDEEGLSLHFFLAFCFYSFLRHFTITFMWVESSKDL